MQHTSVAGSTTGVVKFFNKSKGYGFIATDIGDIHVGRAVSEKIETKLIPGMAAEVVYYSGNGGRTASSITFPRYRGKVKWFSDQKGFGFVVCDKFGDQDVFLHATKLKSEISAIMPEAEVDFFLIKDDSGRLSAHDVVVRSAVAKAA